MSYPRNEFDVEYKIKECQTPYCGGTINWEVEKVLKFWGGKCEDCGAIYDGPSLEKDLEEEVREDKI